MNMKPYVGWGFWGAATSTQRAHFWASWGLMATLPAAAGGALSMAIAMFYRMMRNA